MIRTPNSTYETSPVSFVMRHSRHKLEIAGDYPIAYWKCEETIGDRIDSINSLPLSLQSGYTDGGALVTSGKISNGLVVPQWNGLGLPGAINPSWKTAVTSQLNTPIHTSRPGFSLLGWFKFDLLCGASFDWFTHDSINGDLSTLELWFFAKDSAFAISNSLTTDTILIQGGRVGGSGVVSVSVTPPAQISGGGWHFMALVVRWVANDPFTGGFAATVWFQLDNGAWQEATGFGGTHNGLFFAADGYFEAGNFYNNGANAYMDEVALFDRALDTQEVSMWYSAGAGRTLPT